MEKINWKAPVGIAALCVVSILGLKDTGIFVTNHTTTLASGKSLSFQAEEKASILQKKENGYLVQKGEAKVTVPFEKLIVVEGGSKNYIVRSNVALKQGGKTLRNLFLGEKVTLLELAGQQAVVKTSDGLQGSVSLSNLEGIDAQTSTKGYAKKDLHLSSNGATLNVKKGQPLTIVSFTGGKYIVINGECAPFAVGQDAVSLTKESMEAPRAEAVPNPVQEQKVAPAATAVSHSEAPANGKSARVLESALSKMGSPYIWGSTGDSGFDCSGFVYAIYKNELGVNIPRTSAEQSNYGKQVERDSLKAGDLVFFNTTGSGVSHVGIYIGGGKFIHASSGSGKVIQSSLSEKYYAQRYMNATRVI